MYRIKKLRQSLDVTLIAWYKCLSWFLANQWVLSSVGRASPLHGGGRGFETLSTHHDLKPSIVCGVVVQLVRIPACHAGGRGFEPRPLRHFFVEAGVAQ